MTPNIPTSFDDSSNSIEKLRICNESLERSAEYLKILPNVMKEVYTLFVKERIESLESLAETEEVGNEQLADDLPWEPTPIEQKNNKPSFLISTAKSYLPDNPECAADVLSQIGDCHRLWAIQKQIFKEKYGITWYSPDELNPEIIYD